MPSSSKIRRVLVTGSSGTIGTALCERLLKDGYELTGVDKQVNPWSKTVQRHTKIRDLTDAAALEKLNLKRPDLIVHLAANARVHFSVKDPNLAIENMSQTLNLLEYARKNKIRRVIFASSREVYGKQKVGIVIDETRARIDAAESPYTASKVGGEAFLAAYRECFDIDSVTIRFSNVYGRYDDSERVVPTFIRRILGRKSLTIYGKNKTYDFTFIDDAVQGVVAAIQRFDSVKGQAINLATGKGSTLEQMARTLQEIIGIQTPVTVKPKRVGELMYYVADISKARKRLQYKPAVDLEQGLRFAVEWYKDNCKPVR